MKNLDKLKNIKCFLLDLDGTVYLDDKLLPNVLETLTKIKENSKYVFLTNNSSKSANSYIDKMQKLGIEISQCEIYTSGQATCEYIMANYPGKSVYLVGTKALNSEFLTYEILLNEENPDIVVLGYDTSLTYEKLAKACTFIKKGAIYIATHPDINCPAPEVYVPDVGSFIELIKASTGHIPDVICGKPHSPIADGIKKRLGLQAFEIAMVGDRLSTDIKFANNNNFLSILVLSGETTQTMADASDIKADIVLDSIADIRNNI